MSDRCETPRWWPPKAGTVLRCRDTGYRHKKGSKNAGTPLHVTAVFKDKDGEKRIVVAEWIPWKRRWHYEIKHAYEAAIGLIWLDGTEMPKENA